jgi:signal peptidase I
MPSDTTAAAADQPKNQTDDKKEQAEVPKPPRGPLGRFWHFIRPILILIIVLFAIRSSIIDWNDVPTGSMIPTILDGDRIVVNKLAYDLKVPFTTIHLAQWANPKRGDIVVFFSSEKEHTRLVKRVVAVAGDTLLVHENKLFINGEPVPYAPLDPSQFIHLPASERSSMVYFTETLGTHVHPIRENAFNHNPYFEFGPVKVPEGKYFMMGDNRDNSRDARWFGFVDRDQIVGRATAIALSVDLNHYWLPRWSRFFKSLP